MSNVLAKVSRWLSRSVRASGSEGVRGACLAIAACGFPLAAAAVDLTPVPSVYQIEGARFSCVTFRNGAEKISYVPPVGWKLDGSPDRLNLVPTDAVQAEASITVESCRAPMALDAASIQNQVNLMGRQLPREATKPEVLAPVSNPLKINGRDTILLGLRYQLFGQTFRTQWLVMPVGLELWRFQFTGRESQFDRAYEPFRASLYTIEGLSAETRGQSAAPAATPTRSSPVASS